MADNANVTVVGLRELSRYMEKINKDGADQIKKEIKATTLRIEKTYKDNLKKKINQENSTGDTVNSIDHKFKNGGFEGIVLNEKDTALWLEFGTKPHKIKIKDKKVLSDKVDFFGTEVKHPGTKATLALTSAFLMHVGARGKKLTRRIRKRYDKIK